MFRKEDYGNKASFIVVFVTLFLFWILVSSAVDTQHIIVGFIVAFVVTRFSTDLWIRGDERTPSLRAVPLFLYYLLVLFIEVLKANINVARIVLDPKLPISPAIVKFKTTLKGNNAKVILANSITLTPGTITLDIIGDTFYVHTLTKEAADEIEEWQLEDILVKVENAS